MELAAQLPEPLIEVRQVDGQLPRQFEEAEVVAVARERHDPVALGAEVRGRRRSGAAMPARLKGERTNLGRHGTPIR